MKHEEKKVIIEPGDTGPIHKETDCITKELSIGGSSCGDKSKLIIEANKLIDRAEQIIRDLVAAIKLKPAGGSSCGKV